MQQGIKRRARRRCIGVVDDGHQAASLATGHMHIAGHGHHITQAAGFEVGAARRGATVSEGAIDTRNRQRRHQFGHVGRSVGHLQQLEQTPRRDARLARQAGAVVYQQGILRADALLPPALHHLACLLPADRGRWCRRGQAGVGALCWQRQAQEKLLRHDVVAELVDVTHHLKQRRADLLEAGC